MDTVRVVSPVLILLVMGLICRRTKFFTPEGMEMAKKYVVDIALPVIIFHSMSTANLNEETVKVVLVMFGCLAAGLFIGFLIKGIVREPYRAYLPFLTTVFEGGMLGYPLYQNLCGEEHFANIILVDIAGCLFAFGIYFGVLELVDQRTKLSPISLLATAFRSPTFICVLLGLLLNLTGAMDWWLSGSFADTYLAIKDLVTAPTSALIILYVGYSLNFDKEILPVCIQSVLMRLLTAGGMFAVIWFLLRDVIQNRYMLVAFLVYLICPPSFALTGYVKNKDAVNYYAVTTSLYIFVTVIGYILIATFVV